MAGVLSPTTSKIANGMAKSPLMFFMSPVNLYLALLVVKRVSHIGIERLVVYRYVSLRDRTMRSSVAAIFLLTTMMSAAACRAGSSRHHRRQKEDGGDRGSHRPIAQRNVTVHH